MLACTWGIDHFEVYLKGRKFVVYSDHRPLEKLSCVHDKTLNRLKQKMNEFDFIIQYKKGSEMPADFLSRNVLEEIQIFTPELPALQNSDEFARALIVFLQHQQLPADKKQAAYVQKVAPSCFLEDGILWRRLRRHDAPARTVLVVPSAKVDDLIHETHGALLAGHEGITKTKESAAILLLAKHGQRHCAAHPSVSTVPGPAQGCARHTKFADTSAPVH